MLLGNWDWNARHRLVSRRQSVRDRRWAYYLAAVILLAGCQGRFARGIRQAGRELLGVDGASESYLERKVRHGSERLDDGRPLKDYGEYWNNRDEVDRKKWANQPVAEPEPTL